MEEVWVWNLVFRVLNFARDCRFFFGVGVLKGGARPRSSLLWAVPSFKVWAMLGLSDRMPINWHDPYWRN